MTSFNPMQMPIHSVAEEMALEEFRLHIDFLRQRFQMDLPWQPEETEESKLNTSGVFKPASVLIPLVVREHGVQILLTQRAAHLHHHAGQISFPGGRVDDTDLSPLHTALREAEEEIGLQEQQVEFLGQLPAYYTGTGFVVTPMVALVHPPLDLRSDPFEVASIFEVPLDFLMNPRHHQRREVTLPNGLGRRQFYAMPYQEYFIWGATAGMLRNLFHFLRADVSL
ncbi:CoA pyrophosphatase [Undibacterium sp. LX40W]|uniref:CoA pyrophosphatase n=1 Tax=Undibacterium nitidum TaxID=2762298 RepID=A0A923HPI0_9BURK|nr:CoA pyrophosphatase [Undibacterium nitidum]MBC3883300.1 CoA pyrophosphatase [Undibacterium nitidum]MBC3893553.1 CoA pyrophosphatase [Undibacterium sp. LX40W]